MNGCEIMKCIDYKDGKCHYESAMCKYQESRMEGQEAKDLLFEAQQRITELEAENKLLNTEWDKTFENWRIANNKLTKAEDILRIIADSIAQEGNITIQYSTYMKAQDYFKQD